MFRRSAPLPAIARQELRSIRADKALAWTSGESVKEAPDELAAEPVIDATKVPSTLENQTRSYEVVCPQVVVALTAKKIVVVDELEQEETEHFWWHEVDRALWRPEERVFTVSFTTGHKPLSVRVGKDVPMEFLSFLRNRVENSVVLSETVALTSAENVRLAVRRDNLGGLFVQAIYDPGVDPAHPVVARLIAPAVQRLREVSGAR